MSVVVRLHKLREVCRPLRHFVITLVGYGEFCNSCCQPEGVANVANSVLALLLAEKLSGHCCISITDSFVQLWCQLSSNVISYRYYLLQHITWSVSQVKIYNDIGMLCTNCLEQPTVTFRKML